LVSATQRWGQSPDGRIHYYLREETKADALELRASRSEGHSIEVYEINGQTLKLEYGSEPQSFDRAIAAFEKFYNRQIALGKATPSLEYTNVSGWLMMSLITAPEFANWLRPLLPPSDGVPDSPELDCDYRCICNIASLCTWTKCPFGGGWANFVCVSCGGTSIACTIASFF